MHNWGCCEHWWWQEESIHGNSLVILSCVCHARVVTKLGLDDGSLNASFTCMGRVPEALQLQNSILFLGQGCVFVCVCVCVCGACTYACTRPYYIVLKKHSLHGDRRPDWVKKSRGTTYMVFLSYFCSFSTHFQMFLGVHSFKTWVWAVRKCWGSIYLSRSIYSAL